MVIELSKSKLKKVFKQKYREEGGDICQTGLAIARELTQPEEKEKYNKIWKIVQDTLEIKDMSHFGYTLKDESKLDEFAKKVANNLKNPEAWNKASKGITDELIWGE